MQDVEVKVDAAPHRAASGRLRAASHQGAPLALQGGYPSKEEGQPQLGSPASSPRLGLTRGGTTSNC